jgi:tRNA wybutosine-synthesizing protein 2
VPTTYVRLGDVLVLDLDDDLRERELVACTFAQVLGMRTVLERVGGVDGEFRVPNMRHLWGDRDSETIHTENGVRYRFDPARVMYSPGNLPERQRVATWDVTDETIVDLFAGIGYFSLPLAVHQRPRHIIACEKNPEAFDYLETNVALNHVETIVDPVLGDNRDTAPHGVADRVLMGYLPNPTDFLPLALDCLRPAGGRIHYHNVVDVPAFPATAANELVRSLEAHGWRARIKESVMVKNYGPGTVHAVLDVEVFARAS